MCMLLNGLVHHGALSMWEDIIFMLHRGQSQIGVMFMAYSAPVHIPDSNVSWADVGPTLYLTNIAVWDSTIGDVTW